MSDQNQNQDQNENGKIEKRYQGILRNIGAVIGGDKAAYQQKLPNSKVAAAVEKLIKKRQEDAEAEFIDKMSGLLDKNIQLDKEIANLRKQTEDAINKKKKEFCEEAEKVFKIMENVNTLAGDYYRKLSGAENADDANNNPNV